MPEMLSIDNISGANQIGAECRFVSKYLDGSTSMTIGMHRFTTLRGLVSSALHRGRDTRKLKCSAFAITLGDFHLMAALLEDLPRSAIQEALPPPQQGGALNWPDCAQLRGCRFPRRQSE